MTEVVDRVAVLPGTQELIPFPGDRLLPWFERTTLGLALDPSVPEPTRVGCDAAVCDQIVAVDGDLARPDYQVLFAYTGNPAVPIRALEVR